MRLLLAAKIGKRTIIFKFTNKSTQISHTYFFQVCTQIYANFIQKPCKFCTQSFSNSHTYFFQVCTQILAISQTNPRQFYTLFFASLHTNICKVHSHIIGVSHRAKLVDCVRVSNGAHFRTLFDNAELSLCLYRKGS